MVVNKVKLTCKVRSIGGSNYALITPACRYMGIPPGTTIRVTVERMDEDEEDIDMEERVR